jgi:hypothetical protein
VPIVSAGSFLHFHNGFSLAGLSHKTSESVSRASLTLKPFSHFRNTSIRRLRTIMTPL